MIFFYNFIVGLYGLAIGIAASFNPKAKKWIEGRENWRSTIKQQLLGLPVQPIWIHVSSVGEYEQGQPILAELKNKWPHIPVVLTFFSPSGFELLSQKSGADYVFYLPLDSKKNANDFLDIVRPRAALFIKYEFWYHYFKELKTRNIFFALISASLRENQLFFKWYGKPYRKVLLFPSYFFVQDKTSEKLLNKIGQKNVEVAGDTRIDRVIQSSSTPANIPQVKSFCKNSNTIILGSAWKTELEFLRHWLHAGLPRGWKVIIAPHEIREDKIEKLVKELPKKALRFTQFTENADPCEIMILDTVGILKHVYQYGSVAIIGGGFYDGIHNILEPAVFGLPVIIGPKHHKFPEADALIKLGGAFEVKNQKEFDRTINRLVKDEHVLSKSSESCSKFVNSNRGAVSRVMAKLQNCIYVD